MQQHLDSQTIQGFLDNLPAVLALVDKAGVLLWCNSAFAGLTGHAASHWLGKATRNLPEDIQALFTGQHVVLEAQGQRPGCHLLCLAVPLAGHTLYYGNDVTQLYRLQAERDELQRQVAELTPHDAVTGLLNKRAMLEQLDQETSRSRRYSNTMSVMILRLTRLDAYCKRFGQPAANALLLAISQTLNDQMRWADVIGRIDDNEFLLIMPETTELVANDLCSKLLEQVGKIELADADASLQIDFGMAQWRKGDDVNMLLQRAHSQLSGNEPRKIAV